MNNDVVRVELTDIARTARAQRAALVLPRLIVDAGPVAVARSFWSSSPRGSRTGARARRTGGPWGNFWPGARRGAWRSRRSRRCTWRPTSGPTPGRRPPSSSSTWRRSACSATGSSSAQVLPVNPAAAVRGPTHVVTTGAMPVLSPAEGAPAPRGDRHGHARRPARPGARLGDALQRRAGERGHRHAAAGLLPAGVPGVAQAPREGRHAARRPGPPSGRAEAVDDYLARAGLDAATAALFQSVDPAGRRLTGRVLSRRLVLAMIKRRAAAVGLPATTLLPHVSGDGHHGVPVERGDARARPADRRARLPEDRRSSTIGRRTRSPSTRSSAS